eukprot:gnl/TRDRNA2_/TRDRNA2_185990_c0_seq1.p1 gnl/TRDRNA2_/TRDRNA2_185990_c0~~gnl/TRDRNA2_/TRDRNA2_185990_c0_seq1.p1  ORF type:complete len:158 (-),score=21.60 gnl/TRDRNA2_/TRDRNA2_185990_c0_seq1:83-556(-)
MLPIMRSFVARQPFLRAGAVRAIAGTSSTSVNKSLNEAFGFSHTISSSFRALPHAAELAQESRYGPLEGMRHNIQAGGVVVPLPAEPQQDGSLCRVECVTIQLPVAGNILWHEQPARPDQLGEGAAPALRMELTGRRKKGSWGHRTNRGGMKGKRAK